jgi:uncharacterized membrane protein
VTGTLDNDAYIRSFRWVVTSSTVSAFPAGDATLAAGISTDGQIISQSTGVNPPTRWNASFTTVQLPTADTEFYNIFDLSGDATTIVGYLGSVGIVWTVGNQTAQQITSPSFTDLAFYGVSGDGKIVVGSGGAAMLQAVWWTSAGGVVQLSGTSGAAKGISKDGTVIVGYTNVAEPVATRWSGAAFTTRQPLPSLPTSAATAQSWINKTNQNGSVGVGISFVSDTDAEAVIWTNGAIQKISDIMVANGANISGWSLYEALSVSDDGKIVLGQGTLNGTSRAWIARLP